MEVTRILANDSFKAKCPHCSKSYLVRFQDLTDEVSRFICSGCSKDFWLRTEEAIGLRGSENSLMGLRTEDRIPVKSEPCPKCKAPVLDFNQPCAGCGIVPTKFLSLHNDSPYLKVGDQIQLRWKRVLNHYDDLGVHHEFLSECLKKNHLRFASLKYKQLKEIVGSDAIINNMLKKIENLTQMELDKKSSHREPSGSPKFHRLDQISIVAGGLCIVLGLTSPLMKNWIGVGAVLISLPFVFRYFLTRN